MVLSCFWEGDDVSLLSSETSCPLLYYRFFYFLNQTIKNLTVVTDPRSFATTCRPKQRRGEWTKAVCATKSSSCDVFGHTVKIMRSLMRTLLDEFWQTAGEEILHIHPVDFSISPAGVGACGLQGIKRTFGLNGAQERESRKENGGEAISPPSWIWNLKETWKRPKCPLQLPFLHFYLRLIGSSSSPASSAESLIFYHPVIYPTNPSTNQRRPDW